MNTEERIQFLGEELQVLAFNLADRMDNINFHSTREAVKDMERSVFRPVADMMKVIRDLQHNLEKAGREHDAEEAREMYSLLDVTRKCSPEHESYRHFLDGLIPLLDLLNRWGERGPVPPG